MTKFPASAYITINAQPANAALGVMQAIPTLTFGNGTGTLTTPMTPFP